jgi:hypothetical protein
MVLLLAACAIGIEWPPDPTVSIPDRTSEIIVGKTDRATARKILGEPRLSSYFLRMELYRSQTSQGQTMVAITPWPVPFAHITDEVERYTLVVFDRNDVVSEFDSGIFRRPTEWRKAAPISFDFPWLKLRAGDLLFYVMPTAQRGDHLLAGPRTRDAYLQAVRGTGRCAVVFACGERGCSDRVRVDAGAELQLPGRLLFFSREVESVDRRLAYEPDARAPLLETLVAYSLAPGEHVFEFSSRYLQGRHMTTVTCTAGEVKYVTISANVADGDKAFLDWTIEQSPVLPTSLAGRALVLVHENQWYVTPDLDSSE